MGLAVQGTRDSWQSAWARRKKRERKKIVNMSSLQLEVDLSQWFTEGTFIISVIFALIYIPFFEWRETKTGKAFTTLILAIAGALFRPVLILWGVITVSVMPAGFWNDLFAWLSVISIGAAGVAIAVLVFKCLQIVFAESENKWICRLLIIGRETPGEHHRKHFLHRKGTRA